MTAGKSSATGSLKKLNPLSQKLRTHCVRFDGSRFRSSPMNWVRTPNSTGGFDGKGTRSTARFVDHAKCNRIAELWLPLNNHAFTLLA